MVFVKQKRIVKDDATIAREKLEFEQDHQMVKGIFRSYETPGEALTFSFRKHKEDETVTVTYVDGQIYTIPMMIAKHLNRNCNYPVYKHTKDESGALIPSIGERVQRFGFQSLEFLPELDIVVESPSIIVDPRG